MEHFALDGLWLAGALALAVLTGIFVAQYVKDKLTGVPSALRTALSATETAALAELKVAKAKVVADVAGLFSKAKAAAAADLAPAAPAASAAAPAAPAASASAAAKS